MGCSTSVEQTNEYQLHASAVRQCEIKPHYFVLEIGFNDGQGLRETLALIRDGPGRILGTETSPHLYSRVSRELSTDIYSGTLELSLGPPDSLPFIPCMFDVVYTVNDFHYWSDVNAALGEIYRVLRPSCLYLTCMYKDGTPSKKNKNNMSNVRNRNLTVDEYVEMLKDNGFVRIKAEEHRNPESGYKYHVVKAYTRKSK